jgi:tRNA(fMet)-specific endonuclease VapC
MIYLDTNVVIAATNKRPPEVANRYDSELAKGSIFLISSIVLFELQFGIAKSQHRKRNEVILAHVLQSVSVVPFEAADAAIAGDIRAVLEAAGTAIGPYDLLIAAQALRHSATLVTANTREFERVAGLRVEDWG